jgi:hypothetical protein
MPAGHRHSLGGCPGITAIIPDDAAAQRTTSNSGANFFGDQRLRGAPGHPVAGTADLAQRLRHDLAARVTSALSGAESVALTASGTSTFSLRLPATAVEVAAAPEEASAAAHTAANVPVTVQVNSGQECCSTALLIVIGPCTGPPRSAGPSSATWQERSGPAR